MIRTMPILLLSAFVLSSCSSPVVVDCPPPGLVVDGRCVDLCAELDCDDGNECTSDDCVLDVEALRASCLQTDVQDGTTCIANTGPSTCMAGVCQAGGSVDCDQTSECPDDANPCRAPICEDGSCGLVNVGGACDFMGGAGVCAEGDCVAAALCDPYPCEDRGACVLDQCAPGTGACSYPDAPDGTECNIDGQPAECEAGVCTAIAPMVTGTVPADGATGVDVSTTVRATVDIALDASTVTSGSLVLKLGSVEVPGEVTLDTARTTIIFTPDAQLVLLGEYEATLSGVSTESGAPLEEPLTWQFSVRDGQWGSAVSIGAGGGARVATGSDGAAVVVWRLARPEGFFEFDIWGSYRVGPGAWQTPEMLSVETDGNANRVPAVAMDPSGEAIAMWQQQPGQFPNLHSSALLSSGGWQAPELVTLPDNPSAGTPLIVADADGNYLAAERSFDTNANQGTFLSIRSTPSGEWSDPSTIRVGSGTSSAVLKMRPDGTAIAVWQENVIQNTTSISGVWSNQYAPTGGWGSARQIDNVSSSGTGADVALDAQGDAIAVWLQSEGNILDGTFVTNYWYNRLASGSWGTPEEVASEASAPRIAADDEGNAIAVSGDRPDPAEPFVYDLLRARRFTPTGGWGGPVPVGPETGGSFEHRIAMDARGNALVVWEQEDGDVNSIWYNRYTPGGGWEGAQPLESGAADANDPRISIDPQGTATVVWGQSGVWARHFR